MPPSDRNTDGYTIAMSRRPSVAGRDAPGPRQTPPWWPVALAIGVRLLAWALIPANRFASDEDSYFQVSGALLTQGHQDLFWPPMTGWLLAALRAGLGTDSVATLRFVWLLMDIGCLLAVRALAGRVAEVAWPSDAVRGTRLVVAATLGYALYLPAISHAQFLTSETPALLQLLCLILLVSRIDAGALAFGSAGLLAGTLVLTRPSLLPIAALVPIAAMVGRDRRTWRYAAAFMVATALIVGAVVLRNWRAAGEATISTNSAYNLYIGNRDLYAEDLNLFDPRATSEQIEFRRQLWSGELVYPTESPAELQRLAVEWIRQHPGTFVRRAIGRLARVFVPKTDVLEMLGGERGAGIFSPRSLALLAAANAQWAFVLFGGVVGLVWLWRVSPRWGGIFSAAITGALVLCLVAISKPRYSFVFDPLLLICAAAAVMSPRATLQAFGRGQWWVIGIAWAFFAWAWVAFVIFSLSSRAAL